MTDDTPPVSLKDLRTSECRIARAIRGVTKLAMALTVAEDAVKQERERHDALVERYRTQGRA